MLLLLLSQTTTFCWLFFSKLRFRKTLFTFPLLIDERDGQEQGQGQRRVALQLPNAHVGEGEGVSFDRKKS